MKEWREKKTQVVRPFPFAYQAVEGENVDFCACPQEVCIFLLKTVSDSQMKNRGHVYFCHVCQLKKASQQ